MNKKMRELRAQIDALLGKAKVYRDDGDMTKAASTMDEIDQLEAAYTVEKRLFEAEKAAVPPPAPTDLKPAEGEQKPVDAVKAFAAAARAGFKVDKTTTNLNETTAADGGYTVPEDIQTQINKYRDAEFSLRSIVRVENVSTLSGARTFQKKSTQTGFSVVAEGGAIGQKQTPQFERITYSIKKRGGYFPVTNELLEDSDANIASVITEWIGGESRATDNAIILAAIATKAQTDLVDLTGIKKALNVTLGQAYKDGAKIVTNDDGLQYLDTLVDGLGNPVLSASPADPMKLVLAAGAQTFEVVVIPNAVLATSSNKVPFIIGDLAEAIALWDRQQTTITSSDVAVAGNFNAFEDDMTLFRALVRNDCTVRDDDAFVNGYITVA